MDTALEDWIGPPLPERHIFRLPFGSEGAADLMITTVHFIHRYVTSSVDFFAWRLLPLTVRLKDNRCRLITASSLDLALACKH